MLKIKVHNSSSRRAEYVVNLAYFFKADPRLLAKNIIITNYSEFFFINSLPPQKPQSTSYYAALEVLYRWDASIYSDIWAIGYLIYEVRSGFLLFSLAIQNPPFEALSQINGALGKLLPNLKIVYFNEEGYLERDRCENPVDLFSEVDELLLDIEVKKILRLNRSVFSLSIFYWGGRSL